MKKRVEPKTDFEESLVSSKVLTSNHLLKMELAEAKQKLVEAKIATSIETKRRFESESNLYKSLITNLQTLSNMESSKIASLTNEKSVLVKEHSRFIESIKSEFNIKGSFGFHPDTLEIIES
jgi:hypothetical protein